MQTIMFIYFVHVYFNDKISLVIFYLFYICTHMYYIHPYTYMELGSLNSSKGFLRTWQYYFAPGAVIRLYRIRSNKHVCTYTYICTSQHTKNAEM